MKALTEDEVVQICSTNGVLLVQRSYDKATKETVSLSTLVGICRHAAAIHASNNNLVESADKKE